MSIGDFQGGELCVEESAESVVHIDTRHRVACIDGRYPHWAAFLNRNRPRTGHFRSI